MWRESVRSAFERFENPKADVLEPHLALLAEWVSGAVSFFKMNVKEDHMAERKKIEVFSAGCCVCEGTIEVAKGLAGSSHEVVVYDMHQSEAAGRAKQYGVHSIPSIVIDGKLAKCCAGRGPDENVLRSALA
jgi:glutaredoxin 3